MSAAEIRLWPDLRKAVISPRIYGHFAEHLGRCVYEGIWVGPDSRIPNEAGIRLDVLAALKQLRAPVVRWPGGCFADDYHWRDGVGPVETRPETVNVWWQQTEPNSFGTDEFMRFARAVGCEPYVCVNVGSGSPRESREWVEYCNHGGVSTLTRMRADNGGREPYGVRHWGVGNENWGCGGRMSARDYAGEYARHSNYMRAMDPELELVACGHGACVGNPSLRDWNRDFCQAMPHADLIDHLSIHRYFSRGKATGFSDLEYGALFADLHSMERDIRRAEHVLADCYPDKFVGLVIDEWGIWHPEAVVDNGLEQEHALRDAVFAGACLNLFNRYAHRITMANIAQTINVLQCMAMTDGPNMYLTPTYHAFDMMRPHMGAHLVESEVDCPEFEAHPVDFGKKVAVPTLDVSASISGRKMLLTVANQTTDHDVEARVVTRCASIASASGRVLHSDDPRHTNSFEKPKTIVPKRFRIDDPGGELVHVFPAHSFTSLQLTLG